MSASEELIQTIADRMAVTDVVLRYFELVDSKGWDHMHEVFTDDTTARWTPDSLMEGRSNVVGAMQHMVGSDEIVTNGTKIPPGAMAGRAASSSQSPITMARIECLPAFVGISSSPYDGRYR